MLKQTIFTAGPFAGSRFSVAIDESDGRIDSISPSKGWGFRSAEFLAEKLDYRQIPHLIRRISSCSSAAAAMAYAKACEDLSGTKPPIRAEFIRIFVLELERCCCHLLWTANLMKKCGFETEARVFLAQLAANLDIQCLLFKKRWHSETIIPGGVSCDIGSNLSKATAERLHSGLKIIRSLSASIAESGYLHKFLGRFPKISREEIDLFSVTGPTARAAGKPQDLRESSTYYGECGFRMAIKHEGGIFERLTVRLEELINSYEMAVSAITLLDKMQGRAAAPIADISEASGCSFVEGPASELVCRIISKGGQMPYRLRYSDARDAEELFLISKLTGHTVEEALFMLATL